MPGFSLTLMLLPREADAPTAFQSKLSFDKDLLLELFDAPTDAPGWRWSAKQAPESRIEEQKLKGSKQDNEDVKGPARKYDQSSRQEEMRLSCTDVHRLAATDSKLFIDALSSALKSVIAAEPDITKYDQLGGDGDAGQTLKSGAEGVQAKLGSSELSETDCVKAMVCISEVVENDMGGTSGGLFSIFFSALSKGLLQAAKEKSSDKATAEVWARALEVRTRAIAL